MKRTDGRTVPALLLCAQALWWPGAASARGDVPPASALFPAALVAATVTAALALRRGHPVPALVLVAAVCALGAGPLPAGLRHGGRPRSRPGAARPCPTPPVPPTV
ncbi:hypothetical protein, partial [Streptomyces sp. MH192]|uniref:hypothetical protein n=1 Tax=Streptomyces sp. MH192 TaxID=1945514 RepID=UPI001F404DE2